MIRSLSRLDNKALECNSATNTYQNSMERKEQSPLSFLCHDRINFDDDENLFDVMQESILIGNKVHKIEKDLKRKIKSVEMERPKTEIVQNMNSRHNTEHDETKLQHFITSLAEIAELHPSS